MYSFNLILDLRLLGQSILLFTATDIIKQCPYTFAPIIFFTPTTHTTPHQTPDKSEFQLSPSSHALVRRRSHQKLRFAGLQLCLALLSSHCHHRFHVFANCWHCSFACGWHCSSSYGSLGPIPGCFFFTDPWVPSRAFFFISSLKLSPLAAIVHGSSQLLATHCLLFEVLNKLLKHSGCSWDRFHPIQFFTRLNLYPLQT